MIDLWSRYSLSIQYPQKPISMKPTTPARCIIQRWMGRVLNYSLQTVNTSLQTESLFSALSFCLTYTTVTVTCDDRTTLKKIVGSKC
jgi:hypothetical protein